MKIPFVEMMVLIEGSAKRTPEHDQLMMALDFVHGYMTRCVYNDEGELFSIMRNLTLEKIKGRLLLGVVWECRESRKDYEDYLMEVMSIIDVEDYYCYCEGREIQMTLLPDCEKEVCTAPQSSDDLPPWAVGARPVLRSVDKLPQYVRDKMAAQQAAQAEIEQ